MATTITFEAEGLTELEGRLDKAGVQVRLSINQGLRNLGRVMVPVLKDHTPRGATRHLRNSTRFEIVMVGGEQALEVRQGARSSGGFPYGIVVRKGRRPGKAPPPGALDAWVRVVLGVPERMVRGVAFLVGRKIAKRGTQANPYHERAVDAARSDIQQVVNEMGTRVTAYLGG